MKRVFRDIWLFWRSAKIFLHFFYFLYFYSLPTPLPPPYITMGYLGLKRYFRTQKSLQNTKNCYIWWNYIQYLYSRNVHYTTKPLILYVISWKGVKNIGLVTVIRPDLGPLSYFLFNLKKKIKPFFENKYFKKLFWKKSISIFFFWFSKKI